MVVNVHRNLSWKDGNGFSILDRSFKVIQHNLYVLLRDCKFVVQPSGKRRAIESGTRNVHAFVRGVYVHSHDTPLSGTPGSRWTEVSYNPFNKKGFYIIDNDQEIADASWVCLHHGKAWAKIW